MVKTAVKFTPEILLGSPRRSAGKPSPCGKYILYSVTSYDFAKNERLSEFRVLEHHKAFTHLIVGESKASEAHWLPNNDILYLRYDEKKGLTSWVQTNLDASKHTVIGSTEVKIQDLKLLPVDDDDNILVLGWGRADADGHLVNEDKVEQPAHNSRLYDNLMVRDWNAWKTRFHNELVFFQLKVHRGNDVATWRVSEPMSVHNDMGVETYVDPTSGTINYALSRYGIAFLAKSPEVDPSLHMTMECYFVPLRSEDGHYAPSKLGRRKIETPGYSGLANSVTFSPDGKSIVYLKVEEADYGAGRKHLVFIHGLDGDGTSSYAETMTMPSSDFDINPLSVCYGHDELGMLLVADFNGQSRLFSFDLVSRSIKPLTESGTISDVQLINDPPRIFVSGRSHVDDSFYAMLSPSNPDHIEIVSSNSDGGAKYGLSPEQSTSFWYDGHARPVHCLMFLPPGFDFNDNTKKHPLALCVHGGPQNAWRDDWFVRWHPGIWAAQGYVVLLPNITGSTGYGQDFVNAIEQDWGGAPYHDLERLMEHVESHMPFVDAERAVAGGNSYGGFMMHWIQGHSLARRFKALVCHDGIFDQFGAQTETDEIFFGFHSLGGPPWRRSSSNRRSGGSGDDAGGVDNDRGGHAGGWERWNPSRHIHNWNTPELVIHNERDFRLCIAEGLGAFNVLQARRVPSRLLVAKDEGHWTEGEENALVWYTVVLNWMNKYAGLPPYRADERAVIEPDEPFPRRW